MEDSRRFRPAGNSSQRVFNIAKFDAETAQFDLAIGPSEQFEALIRKVAGTITGAIKATIRAAAKPILRKTLGG
jgi:hypothetical protein